MFVMSRHNHESIIVGGAGNRDRLKITVLSISGDKVQLGIEVPDDDVPVETLEMWRRICNHNVQGASADFPLIANA